MRNRDSRQGYKRAERQRAIAGKFPFHRVRKMQRVLEKVAHLDTKGKKMPEDFED